MADGLANGGIDTTASFTAIINVSSNAAGADPHRVSLLKQVP